MVKLFFAAIILYLGIHFTVKAVEYRRDAKVQSHISRFQLEHNSYSRRGGGTAPMDMAFVTYQYNGREYEEKINDGYLFEYKDSGYVIPVLINPARPDEPMANSILSFWLRPVVIIILLVGAIAFVGIAQIIAMGRDKGDDDGF